jgi:hypothetical protein
MLDVLGPVSVDRGNEKPVTVLQMLEGLAVMIGLPVVFEGEDDTGIELSLLKTLDDDGEYPVLRLTVTGLPCAEDLATEEELGYDTEG